MFRFATIVVLLFAGVSASAQNPPAAVARELVPLQGTWVLTSPDGQGMMPGGELALVITGNAYAQTVNGEVNERGTIKLDPTKKPMALDLMIAEGNDAGKTQLGLIEVSGDTMKGALNTPGDSVRPSDFSPKEGVIMFVGKKKAT